MNCPSRWSEPAERSRLHEPSSECSSPPSRHPVFNATEGTRRPDCVARLSRVAIFADQSCAVRERPPAQVAPPRVGQPARFAHGERFRRTLEKLLDLLLKRASIEAGALRQTFDGLLIKAPHENRAHLAGAAAPTWPISPNPARAMPPGSDRRCRRRSPRPINSSAPSLTSCLPARRPAPGRRSLPQERDTTPSTMAVATMGES